ncbi:MAG: acyl-CoA dehydrogenase family protein, partial [Candidatus Eremiobacteraeota bacterium]|nr:acyl-CoA dehydrogenase family protein [Candidatus Eremiobacteraeota bacterium]
TQDQTLIKESVDRFVADSYGFDARMKISASDEGFSREHWSTYAELGWLGIALPEDRGGFGGTPVETMILMEAFGKGLVLEPFVPTVVLGGTALAFGGTSAAHGDLLGSMIAGELLLSLAYAEENSRYDYRIVGTTAKRDGSDWIVTGKKRAVMYGAAADKLVVSVRTAGGEHDADGITLVLIDRDAPGVSHFDYRTVDGQRASDFTFDGVRVSADAVLGEPGKGLALLEFVLDSGVAALCAEAVGNMSVMQKTTVEYIKAREQFGVPIGSFQVLQHRAVDMLIEVELSRSMLYYGTVAIDEKGDASERKRAVSATKAQIARSGRVVGQSAIQLHGGIGMSEEYMVGHYFKRMSVLELALGDADFHLRRFVSEGNPSHAHASAVVPEKQLAGVN